MFPDGLRESMQATLTALTLDVMAFYAQHFGALAPDFTLYVVDDEEAAAKMTEVLGYAPILSCSLSEGTIAFVRRWCAEDAIASEYFHVLQTTWAPADLLPASDTGRERGAWWLIEGSANYAEMQYLEMVRGTNPNYHVRSINARRSIVSLDPIPLQNIEASLPAIPFVADDLATLAVDWLAGQTSDDAVADYFRLLPVSPDWRAAFRNSFNMTTDDFYQAFESHRAEVIPVRREIRGVVLGPGGGPIERWRIEIVAYPLGSRFEEDKRDAFFGGSFGLLLPDGSYEFRLRAKCGHTATSLGWYGSESDLVPSRVQAEPVVVGGSNVSGIEIRLTAEPSAVRDSCDFGPVRTVSGTVVGPDDQPLRGVRVDAWDERSRTLGRDRVLTGDDGSFVLQLPDGSYSVVPFLFTESATGWPIIPETGWLMLWSREYVLAPTPLIVEGDDVSGVRIEVLKLDIHPSHLE